MKDILFASDLDNTLIVSHRNRHDGDVCVEMNKGIEQSFMTEQGIELLRQVNQRIRFVPITTRSLEQYRRIEWPEGCEPEYAVTTNGGILLRGGRIDENWLQQISPTLEIYRAEMQKQQELLAPSDDFLSCRIVDESYLFLYCTDAADVEVCLEKYKKNQKKFTVQHLGRKIYLFPPGLGKGEALRRLKEYLGCGYAYAAGDSLIDVSMLNAADASFASHELKEKVGKNCLVQPEETLFSEWLLAELLKRVNSD